jgi:hypothetical protein
VKLIFGGINGSSSSRRFEWWSQHCDWACRWRQNYKWETPGDVHSNGGGLVKQIKHVAIKQSRPHGSNGGLIIVIGRVGGEKGMKQVCYDCTLHMERDPRGLRIYLLDYSGLKKVMAKHALPSNLRGVTL